MKNIILEFDKRIITKDEIIEHIKYYSENAEEAMELHSAGDIKGAREIFKDLRKKLQAEYKYYSKVSVEKFIRGNALYETYSHGVFQAYVKQMNPNSNDTLHSNLWDINDYISNYEMRVFFKD